MMSLLSELHDHFVAFKKPLKITPAFHTVLYFFLSSFRKCVPIAHVYISCFIIIVFVRFVLKLCVCFPIFLSAVAVRSNNFFVYLSIQYYCIRFLSLSLFFILLFTRSYISYFSMQFFLVLSCIVYHGFHLIYVSVSSKEISFLLKPIAFCLSSLFRFKSDLQ